MDYIVDGSTITNRLLFLDGREIRDIMGGGGLYAYSAVRMCTENCLFISAVGKDFDRYYGAWFDRNRCSREGLFVQLEQTMYNELKYFPDGSYIEYSIYGNHYSDEELDKLIQMRYDYRHDFDTPTDAAGHIKSALAGTGITLIVTGGRAMLGSSQGVLFAEFDGPRDRQFFVKVVPDP